MTAAERPTWQHDTCPTWCVTEHHEDDAPGDRVHDGVSTFVPASLANEDDDGELRATDLFLAIYRRVNARETWLHLSAPDESGAGLNLSMESARRLADAIHDKVDVAHYL